MTHLLCGFHLIEPIIRADVNALIEVWHQIVKPLPYLSIPKTFDFRFAQQNEMIPQGLLRRLRP